MTTASLTELFDRAGSDVVDWNNRRVRTVARFEVATGSTIRIDLISARRERPQAIKIAANGGLLRVNGHEGPAFGLWSTTSPRAIEITAVGDDFESIDLWNAWRYGGVESAWIGNSGIVVQPTSDGHTLQCSDGVGPVDFTDLVISVSVLAPPTRP